MRELGTTVIASQTVAETIKKMKIVFDEQTKDITFTLFYMVEKGVLKLKGSTGFKDQQLNKFLPETVILNNIFQAETFNYELQESFINQSQRLVKDLDIKFGFFPGKKYDKLI